MPAPAALPAAEAARQIQAGHLSAIALTEALLARIAAREPVVKAFIHLDPGLALRQAAAVDAAARAGHRLPLAGLGFGVKDVLDTADQPSQYGSPVLGRAPPRRDAARVAPAPRGGGGRPP